MPMSTRDRANASVARQNILFRAAIEKACWLIETADARNLANDGPAGGFPPQMTLAEWKYLYVTLDKARQA